MRHSCAKETAFHTTYHTIASYAVPKDFCKLHAGRERHETPLSRVGDI